MTMNAQQINLIKDSITSITDYPKPGIIFRDITSLLQKPEVYQLCIDLIVEKYKKAHITKVVATEARGFLFGAPVALALGIGLIPVRKPGKLPGKVISESYSLEYGTDCLEIHQDAINHQDNVLIIDDLLATGGTVEATISLIRKLGGKVNNAAFVIELPGLNAKEHLKALEVDCFSLVEFAEH